jgi:hypothetical protein
MPTIKSAIQEVRDQLFLDRADGKYLSHVGANIGFERPEFGFHSDQLWRAIVRRGALDYLQIRNLFEDWLTEFFGPKKTVLTVLASDAALLDEEIYLTDWLNIPQQGTLVIDEGLASEQTIEYSLRDAKTGLVSLSTAISIAVTAAVDNAEGLLVADAVATDTVIVLASAAEFPSTGYPFSLLIGAGTASEEVVTVTGRSTGTGDSFAFASPTVTLTCAAASYVASMINSFIQISGATSSGNDGIFPVTAVPGGTQISFENLNGVAEAFTGTWTILNALEVSALANNHDGLKPSSKVSELTKVEGGGTVLTLVSTAHFPATGIVRVQDPGLAGPLELVEYFDNDVDNNVLQLKTKLLNTYTLAAASVTVMRSGAKAQLAQVQVKGVDWEIFETMERTLQIYIPTTLDYNRILDVSYLHDDKTTNPASTIYTGGATAGDTTLKLVDASNFPTAGSIQIGGATPEKIGFNRIDRFATTIMPTAFKATGVIQSVAKANLVDTETFTIDDGTNPASVFEFDLPPNGTVGITVDVSADTTAEEVALTIRDAINGVGAGLRITAWINPADDTQVLLRNDAFGATGNTASSDTVVFAGFTVSNMTGGFDGLPTGSTEFFVQNAAPLAAAFSDISLNVLLSRDLGAEELVQVQSIDEVTNKVTLAAATTNDHLSGATVEMGDPRVLFIPQGLANSHLAGDAVDLDEDEYAGTDLEIGDPTIAPVDTARFQGPYQADIFGRAMDSAVATTLAEDIAGPVDLLVDAAGGTSSLEVRDAILFDSTGQFDLRVGRGKGSDETLDLTGIVFRRNATALTLTIATTAGDTTLKVSAADIALLPNPPGGAPFGYRLLVDYGGGNEEVVVVHDIVGTNIELVEPTLSNHLLGENIELMADVFVLSERTSFEHRGMIAMADRLSLTPPHRSSNLVNQVEEVRTSITVAGIVGFPTTGGIALVNFGRQDIVATNRLASALAAAGVSVVLDESDDFPVAGYPYFVEIDVNTNLAERKGVTNNNTGTETLTISPGADYAHPVGADVRYDPGDPVELTYTGVDSAPFRLTFSPGILLEQPLLTGMPVVLSSVRAQPDIYGYEYPLYLPSTWADRLKFLFDRGRAAGVEIVTIDSR